MTVAPRGRLPPMTHHAATLAAFAVFVLATVWPALPPPFQRMPFNLTALGLAVLTLALVA
jgi:hypothetical protein